MCACEWGLTLVEQAFKVRSTNGPTAYMCYCISRAQTLFAILSEKQHTLTFPNKLNRELKTTS